MHLCTGLSFWFSFSLQRQDIRIRFGFIRPIFAFHYDGTHIKALVKDMLEIWNVRLIHTLLL